MDSKDARASRTDTHTLHNYPDSLTTICLSG